MRLNWNRDTVQLKHKRGSRINKYFQDHELFYAFEEFVEICFQ